MVKANKDKRKVFDINAKYSIKNKGFIVEIKINRKLRDFLKSYLTTSEVKKSDTWKDKNSDYHKYYYRGFDLTDLKRENSNYNTFIDNYGYRIISHNIGILRSFELLNKGKTSYLFDAHIFPDVKECLKDVSDFLINLNKNIAKGIIQIKGYELLSNLNIKESNKNV